VVEDKRGAGHVRDGDVQVGEFLTGDGFDGRLFHKRIEIADEKRSESPEIRSGFF
jgi:hypothetical protein